MDATEYVVFWRQHFVSDSRLFNVGNDPSPLTSALDFAKSLREREGVRFVTMVGESSENVGKLGVDSINDGVLPDGQKYVYVKRRLGGA